MMKYAATIILLALLVNPTVLFDFNENANIRNWRIVDDVVMGGRSSGSFELSPEGHAIFSGDISLENNGGFSSVRYRFNGAEVNPNTTVRIRLKGDGKTYQLRVKHDLRAYYSYQADFETSGDWQSVEIQLKEMFPEFRGNRLNQSNFSHNRIQEVTFQFGNNKPESFQLMVDKITLVTE